ncbi:MAG: hypothetical protein AB7O96_08995 [Pseudobdellovibrionaceae bacterium]
MFSSIHDSLAVVSGFTQEAVAIRVLQGFSAGILGFSNLSDLASATGCRKNVCAHRTYSLRDFAEPVVVVGLTANAAFIRPESDIEGVRIIAVDYERFRK